MEKLKGGDEAKKLVRALITPEETWIWVVVVFHRNLYAYQFGSLKVRKDTDYWQKLDEQIRVRINGNGFAPNDPCTIPLPPGNINRLRELLEILDESIAVIGYTVSFG